MKLRPFELALVIIFVVLGVLALVILSSFQGREATPPAGAITGTVDIWGVLPPAGVNAFLATYAETYKSYQNVSYRYIHPDLFNDTLVNALADGVGPDLVLISNENLVEMRRRIYPDSYDNFPRRDISTNYVDGANIFALNDGLYARPLAVDPLVLYWNRDILTNVGYLQAPRTWEELVTVQFSDLVKRDSNRNIQQAAIALGEYDNIRNSFGVLSMLLLQAGTVGVIDVEYGYDIRLDEQINGLSKPLRDATDFYTRFSNPSHNLYTWNGALTEDRVEFVGERLALYFGYASEGPMIEKLNPNLNFDIAEVPQSVRASVRRTYGQFYGLALLRTTDNYPAASAVLSTLSSPAVAAVIAEEYNMAPAHRSSVAGGSNTTYGRVAYQAAPVAFAWLNPAPKARDEVFTTLINDIKINHRNTTQAVSDAIDRLKLAY